MSRWCDRSIHDAGHSDDPNGPVQVARLFGTPVAETILASAHVTFSRRWAFRPILLAVRHGTMGRCGECWPSKRTTCWVASSALASIRPGPGSVLVHRPG